MVLTEEQEAAFRELCKEIKPGEYGSVIVSRGQTVSFVKQKRYQKRHKKRCENDNLSKDKRE
jgi:hypothetical protein